MAEEKMQIPADEEAERAVLSCILLDNPLINEVSEQIQARDFYYPRYGTLFEAMMDLSASGQPIDVLTLEARLKDKQEFDQIGGREAIHSLFEGVYLAVNLDSYVKIVKRQALRRALASLGDSLRRQSLAGTDDPAVLLGSCEQRLLEISQGQISQGLTPLNETLEATLKRVSDLSVSKEKITGVPTGFKDMDLHFSGFQPSDLILLAARPSMGKTALGVNIAYNAARFEKGGEHPYKVAIFSLEMSKLQLSQRLLAMASGVDLQRIIAGDLSEPGEWEQIFKGVERLSQLPLYIDDTSSLSIQNLRARCRRMKMERGLDLILVDYLQLMTVDSARRNDNRQQEITSISQGLKALAKEMNCPVIAISQLSRKPESREGSRPFMSDMRESGSIEQDADIVMLLYREDYYNPETENANITEVNIAKHRNGPTGLIKLYFQKEFTRFIDIDYHPGPNPE